MRRHAILDINSKYWRFCLLSINNGVAKVIANKSLNEICFETNNYKLYLEKLSLMILKGY